MHSPLSIRRRLVILAGTLILLALGASFVRWSVQQQAQWMREDFLDETRLLSNALHIDRLRKLKPKPEAALFPEFQRLNRQLNQVVTLHPEWRFIYLLTQTPDGAIRFLVDSENPDSPDASPPGQRYDEASPQLREIFTTDKSLVEGPLTDRWGNWVSAYIPLLDPASKKTICVIGVDIDARTWRAQLFHAARIPLLITLLLLGIWIGSHLLLARRTARPRRIRWIDWHAEAVVTALTGLALTLLTAWLVHRTETRNRERSFRHLAQLEMAPPIESIHSLRNLALEGFAAFVENSQTITPREFRQFAHHLAERSEVHFWSWVREIDAKDRQDFETAERSKKRLDSMGIWEWGPSEERQPAANRAQLYPVVYMYPDQHSQSAIGFDLGSIPEGAKLFAGVGQSHLTTASASIPCPFAHTSNLIVLLSRPIFKKGNSTRIRGSTIAALDVSHWLNVGKQADPEQISMANLDLYDLNGDQGPCLVASTDNAAGVNPQLQSSAPQPLTTPLLMFGRTYALTARPTAAFQKLHLPISTPLTALAGLALTLAAAWMMGLYVHRQERTALLVKAQDQKLAVAMHRHDQIARQSRVVSWEVNPEGLYLDISDMAAEVFGYSAKELIGKMHVFDLHPEKGREEFKKEYLELLKESRPIVNRIHPVLTKSGKTIWISSNGIPSPARNDRQFNCWGTDTDITDQKKTEETLSRLALANREAADRYAALIRASNTGAWEYNDSTGRLWCSPEYFSMLGYTREEIESDPTRGNVETMWLNLLHPEDRATARSRMTTYLKIPNGMCEQHFRMRHKDGHWVWIWSRGQILRNSNGQPTNMMVGTHIDITALKQAEEALRESEQQYRMLTENMKDVVWTTDVKSRRFIYLSPTIKNLLGYNAQELMRVPLDHLIPQKMRQELIQVMDERARKLQKGSLTSGTFFTRELPLIHRNGKSIYIELITHYWRNDRTGRIELHAVARDISVRKRMEQEYRTLFHEMLEGFALHEIICDDHGTPVNYRFLAINPAFERMTGLIAGQVIGKTVLEILPDTEEPWIETYGKVALTGNPAFFDSYVKTLGRHFEITAFRPAPNQFACILSDITDRKKAEKELTESRRRYAALLANLPGMAYRCRNDRAWTMEFVSDGCLALTGYAAEDLQQNRTVSFNEVIAPPYRKHIWELWQKCLENHEIFEAEYEITTRTGQNKWVWERGEGVYDPDGNIVALEGFIADIHTRKEAEAVRERLTHAIEQSGETIVITDAGGTILYVNPAFSQVSGYSREETIGRNARILQSGQHEHSFYKQMWEVLHAGRIWKGQIINRKKNGDLFTEQVSISPVRDQAGQVIYYVAVKRDITEQLQNQQEKDDLQSQLIQSQKMESIGRMAGGVAHDFNNMLQAILGYTEMALEQTRETDVIHGDLKEIQKVAQHSAGLTKQLQIFARKQVGKPMPVQLNPALKGMAGMLKRLIGEDVRMIWNPGPDVPTVRIDPTQLDQVVANLCINARDAMGSSGEITIRSKRIRLGPGEHSPHGPIPEGEYALLSVRDNGCGMSPEVMEHLFEPFFTTKQVGKGTGLGLSTVYGIVKQARGYIQVNTQLGKGSEFRIFLPPCNEGIEPVEEGEEAVPRAAKNETVLLVEDEESILMTTRRMLDSLGYAVLTAMSGRDALQLIEKQSTPPDLLLTDVIMPEMNGPELVREVSRNIPGMKHLFMSGYTANLIEKQGIKVNRMNFIQKPFSRTELAEKVRQRLDAS